MVVCREHVLQCLGSEAREAGVGWMRPSSLPLQHTLPVYLGWAVRQSCL
jgi:hypothetical protein